MDAQGAAPAAAGVSLATPPISDFLVDGFDAREYASRAIQTSSITASLARLRDGIEALESGIAATVSAHQDSLLANTSSLSHTTELLGTVRAGYELLQVSMDRLRERVYTPHDSIKQLIVASERLERVTDILRCLLRFLFLARRLRGHLQEDVVDLPKAAACISELDKLAAQRGLGGVDLVAAELAHINQARQRVIDSANESLAAGLQGSTRLASVAVALQAFHHLGLLTARVSEELAVSVRAAEHEIHQAFDARVLGSDAREIAASSSKSATPTTPTVPGGPRRVGEPTTAVSSAAWAQAFWSRWERAMDVSAAQAARILAVERALVRLGLDAATASALDGSPVARFWRSLAAALDKHVTAAAKAPSSFLFSTCVAEYPRVVRVMQQLLFARVTAAVGDSAESSATESSAQAVAPVAAALAPLEAQFLSRSLARLFDPINAAFPVAASTGSPARLPTVAEAQQLAALMQREMAAVQFDAELAGRVARNVAKAIRMFVVKTEAAMATDAAAVSLTAPNESVARNIQLANALHALYDAVWARLDDWSPAAAALVAAALADARQLLSSIAQALFAAAADLLEDAIATRLHKAADVPGVAAELQQRAERVQVALLAPLKCGADGRGWSAALAAAVMEAFVVHAVLVRTAGEAQRRQLADEAEKVRLIAARLDEANAGGPEFEAARGALAALQAMLRAPDSGVVSAAGSAVDRHLVAHHLMGRADASMELPHRRLGMTEAAYASWMRTRTPADVEQVLLRALREYAADVNKRGSKEYSPVYPLASSLLDQADSGADRKQ